MDGGSKTSMIDVTKRRQLFVSSRSKMEIASEGSPRHTGHLIDLSILVPVVQSYLTCNGLVFTLHCKMERKSSAIVSWDLVLLEAASISCVHGKNH